MADTKTYKPDEIALIVGGSIVEDFDEVSVEKDEDKWTFESGSHGELTRTKNASQLGTITVTLPQTNSANQIMSSYSDADALIPILVKDNGGTSLHSIPRGTIQKKATKTYNKSEPNTLEWVIKGNMPVNNVGGNN